MAPTRGPGPSHSISNSLTGRNGLAKLLGLWILAYGAVCLHAYAAREPQDYSRIDRFLDWAVEYGADFGAFGWPVEFEGTGRGVIAMEDVEDGGEILSLPLRLCLTNQTATDTEWGRLARKLDQFGGLVVALISERLRGDTSFYAPYLNILPDTFDALPLWATREISELQETSKRIRRVAKEAIFLKQQFNIVMNTTRNLNIAAANKLTFSLYTWALMVVVTRCFDLGDGMHHALVPLADLLNHHPESPVTWQVSEGRFRLVTRGGGFQRGTQLFSNYGGDQRNWRTLLVYGFLSRRNAMNWFRELIAGKYVYIKWRIHPRNFAWLVPRGTAVSWEMCSSVLSDYLADYRTSIQQDCALLCKETEISSRFRLAVQYRLEKKQLIMRSIRFCETVLSVIRQRCLSSRTLSSPKFVSLLNSLAADMNELDEQERDWSCDPCDDVDVQ